MIKVGSFSPGAPSCQHIATAITNLKLISLCSRLHVSGGFKEKQQWKCLCEITCDL